jgi:hypothetical protein
MTLLELIRQLDTLDTDDTIYAATPWTDKSEAIVAREPETRSLPVEAERLHLAYFLEVIARDVLNGLMLSFDSQPTLQQKCARLIRYAICDA